MRLLEKGNWYAHLVSDGGAGHIQPVCKVGGGGGLARFTGIVASGLAGVRWGVV